MQQINYRPTEKKDYPDIVNLIIDCFQLRSYVSDYELLYIWGKAYLHDCLNEATVAYSAIYQGRCVGIIMGRSEKVAKEGLIIGSHFPSEYYNSRFKRLTKTRMCGEFTAFEKVHHVYSILDKDNRKNTDGILTLFAVREDMRSKGIGTTLLDLLEDYYRKTDVTRTFCYTDSTCNLDFYKNHGFLVAEDAEITLRRDGMPEKVRIYFISKDII